MNRRNKLGTLVAVGLALSSLGFAQDGDTNVEGLRLLSHQLRNQALAEKAEAMRLAPLLGLATAGVTPTGSYFELMAVRDGRPMYYVVNNVNAAITTGANRLQPGGSTGLNLNGAGVTIGMWDGGIARPSHLEFTGRVSPGDPEPVSGNHATRVGGTIIGAGIDPLARGMAIAATLRTFGWTSDLSEMAAAAAAGLRLSNQSYNYGTGWFWSGSWYWYGHINVPFDWGFGRYDSSASYLDQIAYNAPQYLTVKSAGNDRLEGPAAQPVTHYAWTGSSWVLINLVRQLDGAPNGFASIPYGANAKNILTVGAVDDVLAYTGPSSVVMSATSSWGPTDDGRIKPDVVANGVSVYSANAFDSGNQPSNSAYGVLSSTSHAAASATGSLALVLQRWRQLFPGTDPRGSTMKGLAIHTVKEAGAARGPDYSFGHGLLNVVGMCNVLAADVTSPQTIVEDILSQGQPNTYTVYSNGAPIKATLCWTDPAGPIQPEAETTLTRLVNDLDLRIVGASTHYPWVLDPANPTNAATLGDNFRDNVEKIEIPVPIAGWYTVTVSHKKDILSPAGNQAYSLILSGFTKAINIIGMKVNPESLIGSFNSVGWVTIDQPAPPGGYLVPLRSSIAAVLLPPNITIPEGEKSAKFTIQTRSVPEQVVAHVSAIKAPQGWSKLLTVLPGGLTGFSVAPNLVQSGTTVQGVVWISANAPAGGTVIETGDDTTKIAMPTSVTITEGSYQAMFQVGTSPVASSVTRTVYAKMGGNRINRLLTLVPSP